MNSEIKEKFNKTTTIDELISWLKGYCKAYTKVNSIEILRIMNDMIDNDIIEITFRIEFE